jgi:4'-phosphopantetheinyl transferase
MTLRDCVWNPVPLNLILASGEVHLWCASLEQPPSLMEELKQALSANEQSRAERFHFERDRVHFILARGLLRKILGNYLKVEPLRLEFCSGPNGKPALAHPSGRSTIHFNLSHSHNLTLYAFSRDREVGIDLEYIRPIDEAEQIAERYFSQQARNALRDLPPDELYKQFFIYWTRMEAYLKARGDGLAGISDDHDITNWSIYDMLPAAGYISSLAVRASSIRIVCYEWKQKNDL